ncbi:MAG: PQQ-dependent sugar dehydrogenase [bacterium]|nr:PQQ-dependent sugar dehydrogenase [bacterium]
MSPCPARPPSVVASFRLAVHATLVLLAATLLLATPQALAQSVCSPETRIPFAGHSFPLDGALVEEDLVFSGSFPLWNGAGTQRLDFVAAPPDGTNRLFLLGHFGTLWSIPNQPDVTVSDLSTVLEIAERIDSSDTEEGLLGLAFHPDFAENGLFFVHYTAESPTCDQSARCARIVRYQIDPTNPDRALPESAYVVLEIPRPGSDQFHNGGMLAFGPDGYLYVSTGDVGQRELSRDPNVLNGKLLRIDVDSGSEFSPGIPADNPFGNPVWFIGFRNPWRFSFDLEGGGDLWIGDVGGVEVEEVNRVPAGTPGGRDFGWPDCEGTREVTPGGCDGEQHRPDLEYVTRDVGFAVVGGYVYRGTIASLQGQYVFGDFSGKVFAWDRTTRDPGTGLGVYEELFDVGGISSFGEDESGELLFWNYYNSIIGTAAASDPTMIGDYPQTLSETGLFSDVGSLTPAPGLIEYEVNTPLWSDGAAKIRWMALPGTERIQFDPDAPWTFPVGTVFVKHFELEQPGTTPRRLETRIMLRQNDGWIGFTYRWNASGTEASLLVDEVREEISLAGGGSQTWIHPSPSNCLECHSAPAGRVLGVRTVQLNGPLDHEGVPANQLETWNCLGLFDTDLGQAAFYDRLAAIHDASASIATRARDYLDVNCATCHQPGIGTTSMNLRRDLLLADMNLIDRTPIRNDLGLPSPFLVEPGDHTNSVLSLRVGSTDETIRMARGTLAVDDDADALLVSWIDDVLFDSSGGVTRLDSDEDGIGDAVDLCPSIPDPGQENADGDALGDVCDPDQQPDLLPALTAPAQVELGAPLALTTRVSNAGVLDAGPSQVRFHLSADAVLDAEDTTLAECFVDAIGNAGSDDCTPQNAAVPSEVDGAPGEFHFITCADSLDLVREGDESNNCVAEVVMIPEPGALAAGAVAVVTTLLTVGLRRRGESASSIGD